MHWDCECTLCGKVVGVSAHNLTQGSTKNCGCISKKIASEKYCIKEVGNKYGNLIVVDRFGVDEELRAIWLVRCSCGKEFPVKGKDLRSGRVISCPECGHKRGGIKSRADITNNKYNLLTAIKNVDDNDYCKWLFRCDCGGEIICNKASVIAGLTTSCGCRNIGPTPEDLAGQIFGKWIFLKMSERIKGKNIRWDCQCLSCGAIRSVIPGNIKNGKSFSCGCIRSKGEFIISTILQKYNINFDSQKSFMGCVYKSDLFFDFYVPKLNLCIEYDGQQHFKPVKLFGGQLGFEYRKLCDSIKTQYCLDNNIPLLRIPYTQFNNIEQILIENNVIKTI